jgi:hypothetical protein
MGVKQTAFQKRKKGTSLMHSMQVFKKIIYHVFPLLPSFSHHNSFLVRDNVQVYIQNWG